MKNAADAQPRSQRTLTFPRDRGRIQVLPAAVAAIAGHAAAGCYGVMGTAGRGLRGGVAELLHRDSSHRGVEVREVPAGLSIDVYAIVQYGTRITEVAHNLQQAVRFD
ncbi:MAG: Asp23/Gls24 family envelope stress response protein, partial [Candidatus Dormibacterales bacterium]